jgi:pimeloyl-ACP methyl ester carboxylesterase
VGSSDRPEPYFETQLAVQVAIAKRITELLRAGKLLDGIPKPTKVVHVGHSYGSVISNAVAATDPTLTDGLVLTGFSYETAYVPQWQLCVQFRMARDVDPQRYSGFPTGYFTWSDKYSNQCAFMTHPFFEPSVLEKSERGKAPYTLGELLTISTVSLVVLEAWLLIK